MLSDAEARLGREESLLEERPQPGVRKTQKTRAVDGETKKAFAEGRGVREVALELGVLPEEELDAALDVRPMTEGGDAD